MKNEKPKIVEDGHLVEVEYVGTLDDGEEFDNSKNNGPISFIVGNGEVIKGFNDAVKGMKINETKTLKIKKEDAYGDVNPDLIHEIPSEMIPEHIKQQIKIGGFLVMQGPHGQQIPAKVKDFNENKIVLDLNHPLAGKDLNFEITVKNIKIPDSDVTELKETKDSCCDDDSCDCDHDNDDCCSGDCCK